MTERNCRAGCWETFSSKIKRTPAARLPFLLLMLLVCANSQRTCADTWAEKLGYPADRRVLILRAAEMGMCYESNQAGQLSLEQGMAQSVGLMVPCPWFGEFAEWVRAHPDHDVGLALTLNSEWKHYRWGPVAARSEVPGLVDSDGYFWRSVLQFTLNAHPDEVEREVNAQIERARAAGIRPTHLGLHQGSLISRPEFVEVYLTMARKHWIPAVVVELTPDHVSRFRAMGFPISEEMIELISSYPLPKLDDVHFVPHGASYQEKREQFHELVKSLPPGLTQINLELATESDALKRITDDWQQRVWNARLIKDPDVRAFLTQEGVVLTNWKEIMRRFEGDVTAAELGEEDSISDPGITELELELSK